MNNAATKPFTRVSVKTATPADDDLPWYDNTKLVAITTCPTYGILRYGMKRVMPGQAKPQPLLAGSALHDVFAATALLDMYLNQKEATYELFEFHGCRIFGTDRFIGMTRELEKVKGESVHDQAISFGLAAFDTHGYVENESDTKRSYTNLVEAAIAYIRDWPWGERPVWIREPGNPRSDVGIEHAFNLVITFGGTKRGTVKRRFTGVIDGVHVVMGKTRSVRDSLVIRECKTASRLNDTWEQSFSLSHQVTGYVLAASTWTRETIRAIDVFGVQIPQPKAGGVNRYSYERDDSAFMDWCQWFWHAVELYEQYDGNPINAPKYTHSCNRYFRPCEMVAFCSAPRDERAQIIDEMEIDEWDPLGAGEQQ